MSKSFCHTMGHEKNSFMGTFWHFCNFRAKFFVHPSVCLSYSFLLLSPSSFTQLAWKKNIFHTKSWKSKKTSKINWNVDTKRAWNTINLGYFWVDGLFTRVWVQIKKHFLLNFASIFLLFLSFSAFCTKNGEVQISTSIWNAQHPNAGQNMQQLKFL